LEHGVCGVDTVDIQEDPKSRRPLWSHSLFDLTCDFIAQYISSATARPYQISYHPFGRSVEQISLSHLGNKHSHKLGLK